MRLHRETTVHYVAHISRNEAIALLREHDPEVEGLEDLSGAELRTIFIAKANDDDEFGDSLNDLSYETDSGDGPWEVIE